MLTSYVTCPLLTLNNIRILFSVADNGPISQIEFLKLLPDKIYLHFFPKSSLDQAENNRASISSLFNHNDNGKVVNFRYNTFKSLCIDQNHKTLNRTFFNDLKEACKYYARVEAWENITIPLDKLKKTKLSDSITEGSLKEDTLLNFLVSLFLYDSTNCDPEISSFKSIFINSYYYYKENPTPEHLSTLLAYALLCSIFPHPEILDGYTLPPTLDLTVSDYKAKKSDTFKKHSATYKIREILQSSSYCVIIGTHGCGKESIVNAFETYYSDEFFSSFYYYDLSYNVDNNPSANTISAFNFDEAIASIRIAIQNNTLPAVIVLSNWNGKNENVFRKFHNLKNARVIFLTTNPCAKTFIERNQYIDLNQDYVEDRKNSSRKVFLDIYGTALTNIKEHVKLDSLLELIDYHFFSTIILARSMCQNGFSIIEKAEAVKSGQKLFDETDILQHTRNLGLDDLSNSMLQFLRLVCLIPPNGISRRFFSLLDSNSKEHKHDYARCLETSLLQENLDKTAFKLCPHIRLALMGYANFNIEDEPIFQFIIHVVNIAESCYDDLQGNKYRDYFDDLTNLIESLLITFPYKPAQFTSAYISLLRYLWIADRPQTALFYLLQMEKKMKTLEGRFQSSDLAQIRLTMGFIYNSIGNHERAVLCLRSANKVFARQQANAYSLQTLNEYSYRGFNLCLDDLERQRRFFGARSREAFTHKLQIAHILVNQLSDSSPSDNMDVFLAAKKYLDDCCLYFEDCNIKPALATSLLLRAILLKKHESDDINQIIDDLSRAKQLRASVRGPYHSWMIPIYLEEAEVYMKLFRKDLASEYIKRIEKILELNKEIVLQDEQISRLRHIKNSLVLT